MMNSPCNELPPLLREIHSPADVKALPSDKLPELAQEIRSVLVDTLSKTGGHLAPNLGVVELSIALHSVFDSPKDKILFDVSHQSYVHKMLTGRADKLHTIRQFEGLSGFMKRSESPHDAFGAGHAGTALSAALGMAAARDLDGENYHVVAVAGDGAFTCGTTLEALNNVAQTSRRFIAILNDNEWSIDKNVGALAKYFASLQATETFTWLRDKTEGFIEKLAGSEVRYQARKLASTARGMISPASLFGQFGLSYYGPVDGHDIPKLIKLLRIIKRRNEPTLLHIITEKGRGYQPAIDNPSKFHGVGCYSISDGSTQKNATPTYSEIFARTLTEMAGDDPKVTAITAAMPTGTMLSLFREKYPKRFFDVGIAEEHAAIFAAGMASEGYKPYLAVYSTFMQRCIDMIQHDIALQDLPVRLCMDRAGLSPDDGPTHHGLFDIAMMRAIPKLVIMQPRDEAEFYNMLHTMNAYNDGPTAIRYPRGTGTGAAIPAQAELLPIGRAETLQDGTDIALFALGSMNGLAEQAASLLEAQGYSVALINARFAKPVDKNSLLRYARRCKLLCTLEDHVVSGGFGSAVLEALHDEPDTCPVELIGWPDTFIEHGTADLLHHKYGLTPEAVADRIQQRLHPS